MIVSFSAFFIIVGQEVDVTLETSKEGTRLRIVRLRAEQSLADRLRALGMGEGDTVVPVKIPRSRKVFYVRTAGGVVALGRETARTIEVAP